MYKILLVLLTPLALFANLNIAVTYPYIEVITKEIGGDKIDTIVLARGNWDPHFVVPRPSLISKVRNADGLIMNGAHLEIGWLPQLIRRAGNSKININSKYFLNLSNYIKLINAGQNADRSRGDVHPNGNPHFHLDPNNILVIANVIKGYLISIDDKNKDIYKSNYQKFASIWDKKLQEWNSKMSSKAGMKVIEFHNVLAYFNKAYEINTIATIEPLPGIPPSSRHTMSLIKLIKEKKPSYIFHDVYHSNKTAKYISSKTGIKLLIMPHDIGALDSIEDLVDLFDYLTSAIK